MNDAAAWLEGLDLSEYINLFAEHKLDAEVLPELAEQDLKELGIPLGHRKKLLKAIAALSAGDSVAADKVTAPEAERRQLTVMFVDLVGSTALSERLDPEDLGEIMRAYQNAVAGEVARFEGHVAKFMGDGVLVYFGWPRAHEDEAERAVRAGLAAAGAVTKLKTPSGEPLSARIGIATGLVVVGELVGDGAAQEETVIGETPNLAARLQALAEPDSVIIADNTHHLSGNVFDTIDLGAQSLKGFSQPVRAWQVAGLRATESRFAARGRKPMPLIGREAELKLLLARWGQVRAGEGQAVLLSGEPGIGKSRLIQALREEIAGQAHTRLNYQCSPYHNHSALHPVIQQLERVASFSAGDNADQKLDKLEALLGQPSAPLFAALLSIPAGRRYPRLNLTPQRQKQLTLEALIGQLIKTAAQQPVLFILEDVHWIDPTTLELMEFAIDRIGSVPVLMLITFRPEFTPPWTGHAHVTALVMNKLSRRQATALVEKITGGKALPGEVLEQILGKTDGVPLFVEELVKTVLESGLLKESEDGFVLEGALPPLAVPSTLQDSLLARLDRLASAKEVAQIGAAIGREFSYELLIEVVPMAEAQLASALDQLVFAELVFQRGAPPEAAYTFKHALVQDAAYHSLLKARRQQLHARIAQVLEQRFPDTAPEILAYHLTEGGLYEKAVDHWYAAAQIATDRSAYREALAHLEKGLELIKSGEDARWCIPQEIRYQNTLGVVLTTVRGFGPEVKQAHERARALCAKMNDSEQWLRATYGLWLISGRQENYDTAARLSKELLVAVEQERDSGLVLQAHHAAWTTDWQRGKPQSTLRHAEIGMRLYRADDHHHLSGAYGGHDAGVCCRYSSAIVSWLLGYPDQAVRWAQDGLKLARELRHPFSLTLALDFASIVHEFRREPELVREHVQALNDIAAEQRLPLRMAVARLHQAWLLLMQGEDEEAGKQIEYGLAADQALGSKMRHSYFLAWLVEAYLHKGRYDDGLAAVEQALNIVDSRQERWWEVELYRLRGELQLARCAADRPDAEESLQLALQIARRQGARSLELRAATSLAHLWAKQRRHSEAHDLLASVYNWFTEGFDTADLQDAKELLQTLTIH